ncbi:MAG: hypothetical protein QNJ55_33715 [Xenococcus sp. MO_188.B8]|nr:hypothetical protein [Xenococcus sp. MO_188.B8]
MNNSQFLSELKLASTFWISPAKITSFNFSYTWSDVTKVIGSFNGEVQADGNTVKNLSNLRAVVKNSDDIILAEVFDIIILVNLIEVTLDGSSLEFNFVNSKGDKIHFFSTTSNLLFDTSLIIDQITVIPFETINSTHWEMYKKIDY